ncbi:TPA: hypothetical protein VCA04_000149 [Streptococcus suis]|nr:hypothetical protein [Streptococcus suis]HEL1549976.1 hypothetical protein [Streptococcus suis]HEL2320524.1 hypothetical protein [Streptococcus suis]HEP1782006.1 hypothetical protein [Streptococcus suis]
MLVIYFGDDIQQKEKMTRWLEARKIEFIARDYIELDRNALLFMACNMTDVFELLKPGFLKYKLDYNTSLSKFLDIVLTSPLLSLKLPIAIKDKEIYSNVGMEELGMFVPRKQRKLERTHILAKVEEIDKGYRFWRNFEYFRKKSELRWFEIYDLLFPKATNDLTTIKANRDRLNHYQKTKTVPPANIVQKLAEIFLVDSDDFFKKSVSDLQMN